MIVLRTEVSAEGGMDAKRAKEPGGYHEAIHALGVGAPGEVVIFVTVDCQRGKALARALPVEKIKVADRRLVHARVFLVDGNELG